MGRRRTARFEEPQNSRASANPAAETISDKGRSRRLAAQKVTYILIMFCGSKNRAGRSLCPAEARNSFYTRSRSPQAAARKYIIICIATLRVAQFAAAPLRRTATRPKARTALRRRRTASPQPEICAENLKKSPENTENNKKSMQIVVRFNYSYYFWGSDPSKDVNRIAVLVNLRNLLSNSNKRMSRRVVTTPRLVSTSNALRHDGRGPLVL